MKRFLALLTITAAHSLCAVSEQHVEANDPCQVAYQLEASVHQQINNDPQYMALKKVADAAFETSHNVVPEDAAVDAYTKNQLSIFKDKHPELEKLSEQCRAIEHEVENLLNEFEKTPEAQAKLDAENQLDSLRFSFLSDDMDEAQQKAAEAQFEALEAKLEPVIAKGQEALVKFMASHGYEQRPERRHSFGLGYRKIATAK